MEDLQCGKVLVSLIPLLAMGLPYVNKKMEKAMRRIPVSERGCDKWQWLLLSVE
jgi:hypothetical protein